MCIDPRLAKSLASSILIMGTWVVLCEWEWVTYDQGDGLGARCYSPNHQYYIVRLQTPLRSAFPLESDVKGTAKLFDRSGTLLFSGTARLDFDAGPWWGGAQTERGEEYSVLFQSTASENRAWLASLPADPGKADVLRRCY